MSAGCSIREFNRYVNFVLRMFAVKRSVGNTHGTLRLVFVTCLTVQALKAYQYPLPPGAVHEAYVLGRRNDRATADFLAPYVTPCTGPEVSCFVTQAKILTPFAKVIDLTLRNSSRS